MKRRTFIAAGILGTVAAAAGTVAFSRDAAALSFVEPPNDPVLTVPALVVGSGYGGAVAALRLTEAGIPTTIIEMGSLWERPIPGQSTIFSYMLSPDFRSMWFKEWTDMPISTFFGLPWVNRYVGLYAGVLDKVYFDNIAIYRGTAVGGGSIVNGGMAVRSPKTVLDGRFWAGFGDELYNKWYGLAEAELGVNAPSQQLLNSGAYLFTRVSQAAANESGFNVRNINNVYDFKYMEREDTDQAIQSAFAGQVIYGNDHGKRSLDKTYLAKANLTGLLQLKQRTKATKITRDGDFWNVETTSFDPNRTVTGTQIYRTDRLFLAAGVVGTVELLLGARKQGAMPKINDSLGRLWGPNGNTMIARWNWVGTGSLQSGIPIQAIDYWDEGGVLAEIAPMPAGFDLMMSLYLAIGNSNQYADFSLDEANNLKLSWQNWQHNEHEDKIWPVFDKINNTKWTNYRFDLFGNGLGGTSAFTYHPLGGACLGHTVDRFGRLFEYPNVYVMDGSLVPIGLGVNPFLTITAIAERNMAEIVAKDFKHFAPLPNIRLDFTIVSEELNQALDIRNGTIAAGAGICAYTQTNAINQRFRFERQPNSDDGVYLRAVGGSSPLYLAVDSVADGAAVKLSATPTAFNLPQFDDGYAIRAAGSELLLSAAGHLSDYVLRAPGKGSGQKMKFKDTLFTQLSEMPAELVPTRFARFFNIATDLIMDNFGGFLYDGNIVGTWDNLGTGNQRWRIFPQGDGTNVIEVAHTNFVLDVKDGQAVPGQPIQAQTHNGTPAQHFKWMWDAAAGKMQIIHAASGLAVTARRGCMQLTLEKNLGLPNQQWRWINGE